MRWLVLAAIGCDGGVFTTKGETGTTPTGQTGDTGTATGGQCRYDLELWCFNQEYPPGPSQTSGTCPEVTIEGLMDGTGYFAPTHLQCEDPALGTLDQVSQPTGFGGPTWYFDASGALVAYAYTTDYSLCDLEGSDGALHYGSVPSCASWCEVEDPNGWYDYPTCP